MSELKLGLILPPIVDKRTIRLSSILRPKLLPPLPETFDVDESLGGINDDRMFNNSVYGDCVIAARAHQTLRFEKFEQGYQIEIADHEVVDQYKEETGGGPGWEERGLYLLESLKRWRNEGWYVGGKCYTIYAFASVDWKNHDEVKHCIHLLGGVNFGMKLYERDMEQFRNGEVWDIMPYSGSLQGGHGVYLYAYGYDDNGLTCMTWGKRQKMTWRFWDERISEAYGIVDNKNDWMGDDSPVDVVKLDTYLKEITKDRGENPGCLFGIIKRIFWK